jgi:hypothetical protein
LQELYYPYTELCFKGEIIHYGSKIKYWNSQKYNKKLLMSENIEQIKAFFIEFYQEYIERNLENVKL